MEGNKQVVVADQLVMMGVDEITPYGNNPRLNEQAVAGIKMSIQQFGFKVPLVVDKNHVIVTGHTRFIAAKELGLSQVPVIIANDLTEQQVLAFRLADNRLAQNSRWDEGKLSEELDILAQMGFDLGATGFTKEELDCLTTPVAADCLSDLTHESVCGDVAAVVIKSSKLISAGVGEYRVVIPVEAYFEWDKAMLQEHGSKLAVKEFITKALGFDKFLPKGDGGEA